MKFNPETGHLPISRRLAIQLARLARSVLAQPEANAFPYSCKRLVREAAAMKPLCRAAAATVIKLAAEIVAEQGARHIELKVAA